MVGGRTRSELLICGEGGEEDLLDGVQGLAEGGGEVVDRLDGVVVWVAESRDLNGERRKERKKKMMEETIMYHQEE